MKALRSAWRPLLVWCPAALVAVVFYIDLCALLFACGCHSLWNGAAAACNIHSAGAPDCPWCQGAWWSGYTPLLAIVAAQALVAGWPGQASTLRRLALAVLVFPVLGSLLALLYGLALGYWS